VGPDKNIWVASAGSSIERVTPLGDVTEYTSPFGLHAIFSPQYITSGPGPAIWYTNFSSDSIGRITTAGVISIFTDIRIKAPTGIAAGPDGKTLWFCNFESDTIGRLTVTSVTGSVVNGTLAIFRGSGIVGPMDIAAGPDGAMWFTNFNGNSIGRITTAGKIKVPPEGQFTPLDMPDDIISAYGALWFTNYGNNTIGRISISFKVAEYLHLRVSSPIGIAAGPGSTLWFTNAGADSIGFLKL